MTDDEPAQGPARSPLDEDAARRATVEGTASETFGLRYDIDGTPCASVVDQRRLVHIPDNIVALFPGDPDLRQTGADMFVS